MNRQPTEWEKITMNYTSDKGLCKELKEISNSKGSNPVKKWTKKMQAFSKNEYNWP